jgi:orotidine-5'-phosphate decarboxylase
MIQFKEAKERIIIPVDTSDLDLAISTVQLLKPYVGMFKFGLELLNTMLVGVVLGDESVAEKVRILFKETQGQLFWDGKWADIPNTVGKASAAAAMVKPKMVDVHVSGGMAAITEAVKNNPEAIVLGVTVLTSITDEESVVIFGKNTKEKVVEFAKMAIEAGAKGVVCSPQELSLLSEFPDLIKVTPGVRPEWAAVNDQKRVMTPAEAVAAGADYLVIGRPITEYPTDMGGPVAGAKKIAEEIGE